MKDQNKQNLTNNTPNELSDLDLEPVASGKDGYGVNVSPWGIGVGPTGGYGGGWGGGWGGYGYGRRWW